MGHEWNNISNFREQRHCQNMASKSERRMGRIHTISLYLNFLRLHCISFIRGYVDEIYRCKDATAGFVRFVNKSIINELSEVQLVF